MAAQGRRGSNKSHQEVLIDAQILPQYPATRHHVLPLKPPVEAVDGAEAAGEDAVQLRDHARAGVLEAVHLAREGQRQVPRVALELLLQGIWEKAQQRDFGVALRFWVQALVQLSASSCVWWGI